MSLKKRGKIENSNSSKSQITKQIINDMSQNFVRQETSQIDVERTLLQKMQNKILKILTAYHKLEAESKRKDITIRELQKQNQLLKERLVGKSNCQYAKIQHAKQTEFKLPSQQNYIVQRQFTPLTPDTHNAQKHQKNKFIINAYSPSSSIVQEFGSKYAQNSANNLLKQSKSVQNLTKLASNGQVVHSNFKTMECNINTQMNTQIRKHLQERENLAQNDFSHQDQSFMNVMNKLKQKIKRYDDEEVENQNFFKNTKSSENCQSLQLSKVKSTSNLTRRPFNFTSNMNVALQETKSEKNQKQQVKMLKKIWNQRDEQIKRMDQLFKNIDQRLNMAQEQ